MQTCSHEEEADRVLHGTWCTPEIMEAVAQGYKVTNIEEVWHYERTVIGLFRKYIDPWLKRKTEASGFPPHVVTEEQITAYIDEFLRVEGIQLDRAKIIANPGMRALAKLFLNSFWGKFTRLY